MTTEQKETALKIPAQTLTAEDYAEAASAVKYFASPMRRNSMMGAMFLSVAAIAGSLIYYFAQQHPKMMWIPTAVSGACLLLGGVFLLFRPRPEAGRARKWFASCHMAALPQSAEIFPDRAVVKSECERFTAYYTDYYICVETDRLIAAAGGDTRWILVIKKDGLPQEDAERLSALFRRAFDGRWYRCPEIG